MNGDLLYGYNIQELVAELRPENASVQWRLLID